MVKLLWLADVLRDVGLKVEEVPGWKTRGGIMGEIKGVILHHTAGLRTGNMPSLKVIVNGRTGIKGPLAQLGLGRDGTWYVIAAGRANHAGKGSWKGIIAGNLHFIGVEAANTGLKDDLPWPPEQVKSYIKGVSAILKHLNLPASHAIGHKEWAPSRKIDPTFNMNVFREKVGEVMARKKKTTTQAKEVIEDFYVPAEYPKGEVPAEAEEESLAKATIEAEVEAKTEPKDWPWSKEEPAHEPETSRPSKVSSETTPTGLLEHLGWTEYQAAALIAQAVVQSNLDPNASTYTVNKQPTTKENPLAELGSFGIMKWNKDRVKNLDGFVERWNHDYNEDKKRNDLLTQVRFVDWELRNSEKEAARQLTESTDVTEALRAAIGYIRPPGWSEETPERGSRWADRVAAAYSLLDK